jgi:hypothetical protein
VQNIGKKLKPTEVFIQKFGELFQHCVIPGERHKAQRQKAEKNKAQFERPNNAKGLNTKGERFKKPKNIIYLTFTLIIQFFPYFSDKYIAIPSTKSLTSQRSIFETFS